MSARLASYNVCFKKLLMWKNELCLTEKDYLVELLLDDDAEFMEALSALDSLEGE